MALQTGEDNSNDDYVLATRALNTARAKLDNAISVANKVGYDASGLEKARATLQLTKLPDGGAQDVYFNEGAFNQAFQPEVTKLYNSPGGQSYKRSGDLISLSRFEGNFDWRYAPYADQIIKEFGQETPYTAAMAMRLAQDYGVTSLRDLSFDKKTIPGYTDYNLNPDSPTVIPDQEVPVVTIKSTGKVIPNNFASYDNGGTNKNGGATFRFSWDLNPDGTPTIKTDSTPRAGGFINDFVKPILPYAALFIPVIGPELGASMLAGTAFAGNAVLATALGNAVLNLGVQAAAGNIENPSDALKIFAAAGVSAAVAQAANLVTPEGPPTPGAYTTDAGKLIDGMTGGAITGKLADIVGGAVQGGLTGLATNTDPVKAAIMGGTARLSGVLGQSIATSTGNQALGNAVATALNTAVTTGRLDTALSKGGIAGLNTILNETLDSTAREQKLTPDQTKALKAGGALALQTIVSGTPSPQQAIQTIVTTLKNDYDANKKTLPLKQADLTSDKVASGPLTVADANGNLDLGSLYVSSVPTNYSDFVKFASANTGTMSDVSIALPTVLVQGNTDVDPGSFFKSLAESAADAMGLNGPSDKTAADVGQQLFNGIVWLAKNAPKDDPKNPVNDLMRSVTYTVLSGGVDSLGAVNALNGVLKTLGVTTEGGSLDQFAKRVNILSDALTPPAAKAQQEAFSKEWANVKNAQDVLTVLAKAPFNYPLATLKQVISEVGEEGLQAVVTGGAAGVAKLLSAGMKVGSSIGRKADFAYEVAEAAGGAANDAAQKRAEVLQKDLASGKITQQQFNTEVEAARAKGALAGLVIGTVSGKVPDLPKVSDAATSSALNKVVANTLIATVNVIGKEGLPAAAADYLTSVAAGKDVSALDLLKTGALDSALSKATSGSISLTGKARDAGASVYNSLKDTGIDSNKTFATSDADVRSLIKNGGNLGSLTSKVSDSFTNGGVLPEIADIAAKRYVGGTVDKVLYDTLKKNNVAEDKIDTIIGSVTDSISNGGKTDDIINNFNSALQKNGVDLKSSDSAQTELFGTSKQQQESAQYDKRVSELITQGSPVADAQTKAQNELGLTSSWVDWNNSKKQTTSASPSTSTSQVSVSNISASSSPIGSSSVVLAYISASKSTYASNSVSASISKSASILDRVSSISISKSASASTYSFKSTSASIVASSASASRATSASKSASVFASQSNSSSISKSVSASKFTSASSSYSAFQSASQSTRTFSISASKSTSVSNSISISGSTSASASTIASSISASKSISASNLISVSTSKSASQSGSISASKSILASISGSVSSSKSISVSAITSSISASSSRSTSIYNSTSQSISTSKKDLSDKASLDKSSKDKASIDKAISEKSGQEKASLLKVSIEKASKDKASIDKASIDKASVEKASVVKASVEKASIEKASIAKVSVEKASLDKASIAKASVEKASIDKASIAKASVEKASVVKASVEKASIEKASVVKASVEKASIEKASVAKASVEKASIEKASIAKASVEKASVVKASVVKASLDKVSIAKASVEKASIDKVLANKTQEQQASILAKVSADKASIEKVSADVSSSALASASISTSVKTSTETFTSTSISASISASTSASVSTSIIASASVSVTTSVSASVSPSISTSVNTSLPELSPPVTSEPVSSPPVSSKPPSSSLPITSELVSSPPVSSGPPSSSPPSSSPPSSSPPSSSPPSSSPPKSSPPVSPPPVSSPAPKSGFQFTVPQIAEVAAAATPFLETTTKIIGGTPQYKGILDQFFAKAKEPLAPTHKPLESEMPKQQYYEYGESTPIGDILGETGEQPATEEQGFARGGLAAPFEKLYKSGKMRTDFRRGDAVSGPGDGQSDDIPAMLADGEFVFPADVVAALGNGSTKAGSEQLYKMMHNIRSRARKAAPKELPPKALSPLEYLKRRK